MKRWRGGNWILDNSSHRRGETPAPRRQFTPEQKAEAVKIMTQLVSQIAREMGLTESVLRNWVKQTQIDQTTAPNGSLTTKERQELA